MTNNQRKIHLAILSLRNQVEMWKTIARKAINQLSDCELADFQYDYNNVNMMIKEYNKTLLKDDKVCAKINKLLED